MSHSYCNNHVHIIYSTKGRQPLILPEIEKRLYPFIAAVAREQKIALLAAGGMADHCHLLVLIPATMGIATAVNFFKGSSSRFLSEQGFKFQWQIGYGAFSVNFSRPDRVIAYVRNQREHHRKKMFEEEFVAMLKKAGVAYDPKFVFG